MGRLGSLCPSYRSDGRLDRVVGNNPAMVDRQGGQVILRFSPLNSFDGVVIHLTGKPGCQLLLSLFANDKFSEILVTYLLVAQYLR